MNTLLLGFGHKAQIGKDYGALGLMQHFDVERVAFADALKRDLAPMFIQQGIDYWRDVNDPIKKKIYRPLMVEYGCAMRAIDPDHWVKRAIEGRTFTHAITVVTDVRFPNEVRKLKELGGYYVDIYADVEPANDTERAQAAEMEYLKDYTVINKFDGQYITDLVQLVNQIQNENRPNQTS